MNVVLFMVDQLAARWLEAALDSIVDLPNVRRLRAAGTTFSNAFTSNPLCCPSRATIATGLTTRGHGVLENGYALDPELPTFMRVLQQAGFRTGAFGKVHYRPHFAGLRPDYRPYGFDVTHITEDPRGGEWLDWVEREHPDHYEAALATVWASSVPDFSDEIRGRIGQARERFKLPPSYALPFPSEVSQTEWITGHALDFIQESPEPFFAHVSYVQPHSPFCAPSEYIERVDVDRIPEPAPDEWSSDERLAWFARRGGATKKQDWRQARRVYFADIAHLDAQLGRILDAVDLETTHVLFLSDHGELLFDHDFLGKEELHYDACIRVPLMIAGPGIAKDVVRDEIVQLEDIAPTILDMAGQSMPAPPVMGPHLKQPPDALPGRSLLRAAGRDAAYIESYNAIWSSDPGDWARTIRTPRYRYTWYSSGEQLFDLVEDPSEQVNLATTRPDLKRELKDVLFELVVMQDFPKTRRNLFAFGVH